MTGRWRGTFLERDFCLRYGHLNGLVRLSNFESVTLNWAQSDLQAGGVGREIRCFAHDACQELMVRKKNRQSKKSITPEHVQESSKE